MLQQNSTLVIKSESKIACLGKGKNLAVIWNRSKWRYNFYREKLVRQILQYHTVSSFGFLGFFQTRQTCLKKTDLLLKTTPETRNQPLPQCKPPWNSTISFNNLKPNFKNCCLDGRGMNIKNQSIPR